MTSPVSLRQGEAARPGLARAAQATRLLDPFDRVSEVLFGLIMVLTFTGSLSVAEADRAEVKTMLIGALGCNLAWAVIDAVLFLMGCAAEKGGALAAFRAVRAEADPAAARRLIAEALPEPIAAVLRPDELDSLRERLARAPEPSHLARLSGRDWASALAVFALVFASTFPVAVPFLFMSDIGRAMRMSNGIAIVLLFVLGWVFARASGRNPWAVGGGMVLLGSVLVALTITLGG